VALAAEGWACRPATWDPWQGPAGHQTAPRRVGRQGPRATARRWRQPGRTEPECSEPECSEPECSEPECSEPMLQASRGLPEPQARRGDRGARCRWRSPGGDEGCRQGSRAVCRRPPTSTQAPTGPARPLPDAPPREPAAGSVPAVPPPQARVRWAPRPPAPSWRQPSWPRPSWRVPSWPSWASRAPEGIPHGSAPPVRPFDGPGRPARPRRSTSGSSPRSRARRTGRGSLCW
jgi:hypothetical protein